ncbi:hypothetical protein AVEN_58664-1 [Araneus ventricosus]|uniref:Uncharacterized protein n=1 Tax=Araneus ventricosus TaxID=182803 RepID=A0A4Y2I771_ARAVE|nr:hypothetical protein AVEN_58664-1 [Araneus ventricosus]
MRAQFEVLIFRVTSVRYCLISQNGQVVEKWRSASRTEIRTTDLAAMEITMDHQDDNHEVKSRLIGLFRHRQSTLPYVTFAHRSEMAFAIKEIIIIFREEMYSQDCLNRDMKFFELPEPPSYVELKIL